MENPTHAHISLSRLGGVNIKAPVVYRGKSVYMDSPNGNGKTFRLNAKKFIAGETSQIRDSYAIRPWDAKAERTAESEKNWQT